MTSGRSFAALAATWMVLGHAVACSSGDEDSGSSGDDPWGDGPILVGVDGQAPPAASGTGASGGVDVPRVVPVVPGAECAGNVFDGEAIPLHMIVMMDRSVSMGDDREDYLIPGGGTKWDAVREGFVEFVDLPQSAGIGMGIDFFGQDSCDAQDYSTPDVQIDVLPGVGPYILDAYDGWNPGANTPMRPALEGAIMYAEQWQADHPGNRIIVVLVTDGVPNGCGDPPEPSDQMREGVGRIAEVAAAGLAGNPSIRTFVLGIEGLEVPVEDFRYACTTIATAGGSQAVIIEANDDLAAEFSAALDGIREEAAPPCTYGVPLPPPGEELNLNQVNVVLQPPGGREPEGILNVASLDQCGNGGWYYDPPDDPATIELCPSTCGVVSQLNGASFQVVFGCATVTGPVY
jgi:hypothetical protein